MATDDWDEIMAPIRALEPAMQGRIRVAIGHIMSAEMRSQFGEDHGFGISSSDTNHRLYSLIKYNVAPENRNLAGILKAVVDEMEWVGA